MRHALSFSIACAGLLLAQATSPALAQAAAPAPRYPTTRVEVDASKLEGEGSTLEKSVASLARNEVRQVVERRLGEHLTVVGEGGEAVVYVELLWRDYETSHYGVRVEIRRGESSELVAVEECKLCDEEKLARKVAGRVPELLPLLAEAEEVEVEVEAEPEVGAEVEPEPEPTEPEGAEPVIDTDAEPESSRVGVAGYVGIASLALGVAGVAGGVAVLLEEPTRRPVPEDHYAIEVRDRVPLGGTLVGIGAGLLVTGVVLVAVDQAVLRKRRARRSPGAVFVPTISPVGAGLGVMGRF